HLLDEIRRAMQVRAPGRRRHADHVALAEYLATECFQDRPDLALGQLEPRQLGDLPGIEGDAVATVRRGTGGGRLRWLSAADLVNYLRRQSETRKHGLGIDAALEAVARIRHETGFAARLRRARRIEVSALDQHVD